MLQKLNFVIFCNEKNNLTILKEENLNTIKKKIKKTKASEIEIDLSSLNIIEASKLAVLSSALYYGKNPEGKIKCRLQSAGIRNFITGLALHNIEFV